VVKLKVVRESSIPKPPIRADRYLIQLDRRDKDQDLSTIAEFSDWQSAWVAWQGDYPANEDWRVQFWLVAVTGAQLNAIDFRSI
jgi:hypothetical protein